MALLTHVGTFNSPGSTGNQSVTGVGFQPKIVIFVSGRHQDDDSFGTGSHGAAVSSSAQWACTSRASDGGSATRGHSGNHCVAIIGGSTVDFFISCAFVSLDADGFTVNFDNISTGTTMVIHYLALGGDDLNNANVIHRDIDFSNEGVSITGVGFQPNVVLGMGGTSSFNVQDLRGDASISSGVAHGPANQQFTRHNRDNGSNQGAFSTLATNGFVGRNASNGSSLERIDLTGFDADGFSADLGGSGTTFTRYGFVCLNVENVHTGLITQPTSNGTQAITGVGFQPEALYIGGAGKAAAGSINENYWMAGVADADRNQGSHTFHRRHNTNDVAGGLSTTQVIRHIHNPGTGEATLVAATLDSLDSDGFTLDWTATDATERRFWYMAIAGDDAVVDMNVGSVTETETPSSATMFTDVTEANVGSVTETETPGAASMTLGGTQFLLDFRNLSPGGVPSNVTVKDNQRNGTWDMAVVQGENRLRFHDDDGGGQTFAIFDDVTEQPDRATEEVLGQIYIDSVDATGIHQGVFLRYQDDSGATNDYTTYLCVMRVNPEGFQIARFAGGDFTSLGIFEVGLNTDTFYNMRFRVEGTGAEVTLRANVWAEGAAERGTTWGSGWDLTVVDDAAARITTPNLTGALTGRSAGAVRAWSFLSVATNENTAEHPDAFPGAQLVTTEDTMNVHPAFTGIVDGDTAEPHVDIVARSQQTGATTAWQQAYFKLEGVNGKRPTFRLSLDQRSNINVGTGGSHVPFFSYDGETWVRPDITVSETSWGLVDSAAWQWDDAFTQDDVFVAYQIPYPMQRNVDLFEWIEANHPTRIHDLPSNGGEAQHRVSRFVASQTDDLGRELDAQPLYAYGLWNPGGVDPDDRPVILLAGGIHAGEQQGDWIMEGLIRWFLSGTSEAEFFMDNFAIFVYPNINPMGRFGGHYRGQWDANEPTKDTNRDYLDEDKHELDSTQKLISAFGDDIDTPERQVWWSFDFHGHTWRTDKNMFYIATFGDSENEAWRDSFIEDLEAISDFGPHSFTEGTFANLFTRHPFAEWDTMHTYAVENVERSAGLQQDDLTEAGETLGEAMFTTAGDEWAFVGSAVEREIVSGVTVDGGEAAPATGLARGGVIMRRRR